MFLLGHKQQDQGHHHRCPSYGTHCCPGYQPYIGEAPLRGRFWGRGSRCFYCFCACLTITDGRSLRGWMRGCVWHTAHGRRGFQSCLQTRRSRGCQWQGFLIRRRVVQCTVGVDAHMVHSPRPLAQRVRSKSERACAPCAGPSRRQDPLAAAGRQNVLEGGCPARRAGEAPVRVGPCCRPVAPLRNVAPRGARSEAVRACTLRGELSPRATP